MLDLIATELKLALSVRQRESLLQYVALLQKWNATYNLTSIRDPLQMMVQHIADSLAVVAPLAQQAIGASPRLLDAGSGAGLPGVVMAILRPQWRITCVDAVGKKMAFVRQAAGELRLSNVDAVHARLESLVGLHADVVVSRAYASLQDMIASTRHHLAPGGVWAAMKGKMPTPEVAALAADIEMFHVEPLTVPFLHAERCVVWMRLR
ncbi:MAG: 16S rRNA (guanine(527)-N(7))-methyltransferase RsmG [Burkholderiaceae bacterium]